MITTQLRIVNLIFDSIFTHGKIILGKKTVCIIEELLDKEVTVPCKVLEKQPQIITPRRIQTEYILSELPLNIANKK